MISEDIQTGSNHITKSNVPSSPFDVCPSQIKGSVQDFCTICLNGPVSFSSSELVNLSWHFSSSSAAILRWIEQRFEWLKGKLVQSMREWHRLHQLNLAGAKFTYQKKASSRWIRLRTERFMTFFLRCILENWNLSSVAQEQAVPVYVLMPSINKTLVFRRLLTLMLYNASLCLSYTYENC